MTEQRCSARRKRSSRRGNLPVGNMPIRHRPDVHHLEGPPPSVVATTEGGANRVANADYQPEQGPGTARRVYNHLAQGRPVAIAVPVFARADGSSATNWSSAITSGEVLDPFSDRVFAGGHAVCVVGFQPDPAEANGGWFIFRNSVGGNWASGFQPDGEAPRVPARGFRGDLGDLHRGPLLGAPQPEALGRSLSDRRYGGRPASTKWRPYCARRPSS